MDSIAAVILAGGKSSRMGQPKELLPWRGGTIIRELVKEVLASRLSCLVVSNSPELVRREVMGYGDVRVTPDLVPSSGPVSGLVTAFRAREEEMLLILSCDLPFLNRSHIDKLLAFAREEVGWDVIAAKVRDRLHPLFALYHRRTQQAWEEALAKGQLRLMDTLARLQVKETPEGLIDDWAVFNANTPEEYRLAMAREEGRKQDGGK